MKYLLWLVLLAVVWWVWSKRRPPGADEPSRAGGEAQPERMVACAHCGVFMPQSDALAGQQGRFFCCDAHRVAQDKEG